MILVGLMILVVTVLAMKADALPWPATLSLIPFLVFVFLVGFKLIRRQGKRHAEVGRAKKASKL